MKFPLGFKYLGGKKQKQNKTKGRFNVFLDAACSVPLLSGNKKEKGRKSHFSLKRVQMIWREGPIWTIWTLEIVHYTQLQRKGSYRTEAR